MSRGQVLVFFYGHSTRMYLMKEKQGGPIPTGLKRWPLKLIKHQDRFSSKEALILYQSWQVTVEELQLHVVNQTNNHKPHTIGILCFIR